VTGEATRRRSVISPRRPRTPSRARDLPPTSSIKLLVAAATVLLYGVLVAWACVSPDYRAPDEPQHVSTLLRLAYSHSYPAPGDGRIYPAVKGSYPVVGFGGIGLNSIISTKALTKPTAAEQSGQTLRTLALTTSDSTIYDYDQMTQHPPGYYLVMSVPARLFDVIDDTPRSALLILRICSALLLLPLPFLTFKIARAIGASSLGAAAGAFLPAALPQLTHIGGAVNNDTLTITMGAAVTWLALEVARGRDRRFAVGLGLAMSGLLLTKGIGLPMLAFPVVAYLVRVRRDGLRATVPDAVISAVLTVPGLLWWLANVVRFGTLQPDGYSAAYLNRIPKGSLSFGGWLHGFFPAMFRSFFFDVGWLEAPSPTGITVLFTLLLAVSIVVAIGRSGGGGWTSSTLLAQLAWLMPLIAILDTSHGAWKRAGALQGIQGRYLFVGVAALAATVAVAARPRSGGSQRSYAVFPLFAAIAAGVGLLAGVVHFYAGSGITGRLGTFSAWSPLRFRELGPIAVIVAVIAIGSIGMLWRLGGRFSEAA
jgi:4-amino-4-deoxy-L-arabinose transferase-like glycosyltransferase